MNEANHKLNNSSILIAGPTGVGKSTFAVALAQRVGGEILCADAYQLYQGLPILTAQPSPDAYRTVPHHLYHHIDMRENCDVVQFLQMITPLLEDVQARGKIPILVGGTGLYMKAFTHGLDPLPTVDEPLRQELSQLPLIELQNRLRTLDAAAFHAIDILNPRRVIRAIEIVTTSGLPLAEFRSSWQKPASRPHIGLYLQRSREDLHQRIAQNVHSLFAQNVVKEVRAALAHGIGDTASRAIGFQQITSLLEGKCTEKSCQESILIATRQYAKRQSTWFRAQEDFLTLPLEAHDDLEENAEQWIQSHPEIFSE